MVGEQWEGEPVLHREILVALDALQADAPDLGAEFFEAGEVILIAAQLLGADLALVERIERQHHGTSSAARTQRVFVALEASIHHAHARQAELRRAISDLKCPHRGDHIRASAVARTFCLLCLAGCHRVA